MQTAIKHDFLDVYISYIVLKNTL